MKIIEQTFPGRSSAINGEEKKPRFRGAPRTASRTQQLKQVPTSGWAANGTFVELVRKNQQELLLRGSSDNFQIVSETVDQDRRYVASASAKLIRHLPSKPADFGRTRALFQAVTGFISAHCDVEDEDARLLGFIVFSSYFSDCLSTSPCLMLLGAPYQAVSLLRVLECVCRHAVLSTGAVSGGVVADLRPTRLICQTNARVERKLAALQFSGFGVFDTRAQLSGTSVIYAGNSTLKGELAEVSLQMWVSPENRLFGVQEENAASAAIRKLQNQFLMYRLRHYGEVKNSKFDVPDFAGATREHARSLGRCIVNAPELQSRLITLLRERNDAERAEHSSLLDAVVIEALGVCCHERKSSVHVGEVAQIANAILSRSGQSLELSPKQVGARMKSLGFRTTRLDASGRGLYLLKGECDRVHKVGRALNVPIFIEKLPGCPYCQER